MKKIIVLFIFVLSLNVFSKEFYVKEPEFLNSSKKIVSEKIQLYSYRDGRFGLLKKSHTLSFFFVNTDFIDFKGYEGKTAILFNVEHNKIKKAVLVKSEDTPDYMNYIEAFGYYDLFKDLLFFKDNKITLDVDIISGATSTTKAVNQSIKQTLVKINPFIQSVKIQEDKIIFPKEYKVKKR